MSYQVALDTFHGPLDLLLYLVRKNEVDVLDVPLADLAGAHGGARGATQEFVSPRLAAVFRQGYDSAISAMPYSHSLGRQLYERHIHCGRSV